MSTYRFDHHKLHAYQLAIEFAILAERIAHNFPRRYWSLADQLRRAAISIALNLAEGAAEFSIGEKVRFYRIARRSVGECAAIVEIATRLNLCPGDVAEEAFEVLDHLMGTITKLTKITRPK